MSYIIKIHKYYRCSLKDSQANEKHIFGLKKSDEMAMGFYEYIYSFQNESNTILQDSQ